LARHAACYVPRVTGCCGYSFAQKLLRQARLQPCRCRACLLLLTGAVPFHRLWQCRLVQGRLDAAFANPLYVNHDEHCRSKCFCATARAKIPSLPLELERKAQLCSVQCMDRLPAGAAQRSCPARSTEFKWLREDYSQGFLSVGISRVTRKVSDDQDVMPKVARTYQLVPEECTAMR
jgi:hypothetical protein